MFVPFLIMLREGTEAALIVSLIASYLKRTQRGNWIGVMWIGVILAAALCLGLAFLSTKPPVNFLSVNRSCSKDRRGHCGGDPDVDGLLDAQCLTQRQAAAGAGRGQGAAAR